MKGKSYLTVNVVSKKLGLESHTVQNMCKKGMFKDAYQTEGGIWLVPEDNFVTTRKQDEKAEEILQHIDRKNQEVDNDKGVEYIDAQIVADYYDVELEKVISWIKQRYLSGKEMEGEQGRYMVPKEEFEYLKSKRENDTTEEKIKKLLGSDYIDDWDVEFD